jgi:hypothetical protein
MIIGSKNDLWCQDFFEHTYVSEIVIVFFGNCQRSVKHMMVTSVHGQFNKIIGMINFDPAHPASVVSHN